MPAYTAFQIACMKDAITTDPNSVFAQQYSKLLDGVTFTADVKAPETASQGWGKGQGTGSARKAAYGPTEPQAAYIVKLLASREVPSSLRAEAENVAASKAVSALIDRLKACPWRQAAPAQGAAKPKLAAAGFYCREGLYYKVKENVNSGRRYASVYSEASGTWEYAKGMVMRLTEDQRLTQEQAAAFGHLYGVCCICTRTLSNDQSIERGIGSVCYAKMGW